MILKLYFNFKGINVFNSAIFFRCCLGITTAIGNLLLIDVYRSINLKKEYKCTFNLSKNQHPFIRILSQDKDIWLEVYSQIQMFVKHFDEKITSNSLELLRPVFLYVLCTPVNKLSESNRRNAWNLLISVDREENYKFAFEILSWLQVF